jgi:hypothetical protein
MADSLTKQIGNNVVAVIGAVGKPAGVTVNKSRDTAVSITELPMYSVYLGTEQVAPIGQPKRPPALKRTLDLTVKIRVNGTDDDTDPHAQWIISQINADTSLGGVATYVEETQREWFSDEASDGNYTAQVIHFSVEYMTKPGDITAK